MTSIYIHYTCFTENYISLNYIRLATCVKIICDRSLLLNICPRCRIKLHDSQISHKVKTSARKIRGGTQVKGSFLLKNNDDADAEENTQ